MARVVKYTRKQLLKQPVHQLDPAEPQTVADLLDRFKDMSFQARSLGNCLNVWENMLQDKDRPTIILGLSGSLIAGGLRRVFARLIEHGLVDVVVTTGALPYQDLYQARGYHHWKGHQSLDDLALRELMLDRLYDAIVDEDAFRETDEALGQLIAKLPARGHSSREILAYLGDSFDDEGSWVVQAARTKTPVFAPALNDSSIGIGMVHALVEARKRKKQVAWIDPIRDAYELSQVKFRSKKTGVIYIGGGIPKNYIQQTEVISEVLGYDPGGHQYAFQITADAPHWGGLSGCTLEEAQSWGKIAKDAVKATAYCDATIGLSMIATALFQKKQLWQGRKRLAFEYSEDGELAKLPVRR